MAFFATRRAYFQDNTLVGSFLYFCPYYCWVTSGHQNNGMENENLQVEIAALQEAKLLLE